MAGGGEQCHSFHSVVSICTLCVSLCASACTGSHCKSCLLFQIYGCRNWKCQFIITRQTLLEPIRLCLAVEPDFPEQCEVMQGLMNARLHNTSWGAERSLSGFMLFVSPVPLSAHWVASAAGLERLAWLLRSQERPQQRGREKLGSKRCHNEAGELDQPPNFTQGAQGCLFYLHVSGVPFHQDLGHYKSIYTTVSLPNSIFPSALVIKVCLRLPTDETMAWFFMASHFCFTDSVLCSDQWWFLHLAKNSKDQDHRPHR